MMATYPSRRRLGVRKVAVREVEHLRVHYDPTLYMYGPNRGGIWNFGDGELAVAYLAGPVDYQAPLAPLRTGRHAYPITERGAKAGGGGELPEDGLAAYGDDSDDLMLALARQIVNGEDTESVEQVFAQARDAENAAEEYLVDDGWKMVEAQQE